MRRIVAGVLGDCGLGAVTGDSRPELLRPRRSVVWSLAFRAGYRLLRVLDPLIRSWIANDLPGLGGIVELRFVGHATGRRRRALVTLLPSDGRWYIGHPNGSAAWIRNVEKAGSVEIEPAARDGSCFRVERLLAGPERDAVIRATARQQPFPANLLYRVAQRHIAAVGVYLRLEPLGEPAAASEPPASAAAASR